jgi:hypothetical protein
MVSNEEEEIGWDEGNGEEAWGLEKLIWKKRNKSSWRKQRERLR